LLFFLADFAFFLVFLTLIIICSTFTRSLVHMGLKHH
jgi:hypothetical protein